MIARGGTELGQLFMVAVNEDFRSAALSRRLAALNPAGFLFTTASLRAAEPAASLLYRLARTFPDAPLLAIEEEGGAGSRLRQILPALPAPRAVAARGRRAVEQQGDLIGAALRWLGFNTDLAPVLDLSTPLSDPLLGARTFHSSPRRVAAAGRAFLRGIGRHGILACGKQFPGFGSVPAGLEPVSAKSMAGLWQEDLIPYRELIRQLPLVLLSRAAYKAYDFDFPCPAHFSSSIIEGLLRLKLGFRGVAVADLTRVIPAGNRDASKDTIESLRAGCDLLILADVESAERSCAALKEAVGESKLTQARVRQALARIKALKRGRRRPPCRVERKDFQELYARFERFSRESQSKEKELA